MESYFVSNGDVIVHVLDNGAAGGEAPPLLVLGGVWESAEGAAAAVGACRKGACS